MSRLYSQVPEQKLIPNPDVPSEEPWGIITLADDIGRETIALTLINKVIVVAPKVIAAQQAHWDISETLDRNIIQSGCRI